MKKIGLISGKGEFPIIFSKLVKELGFEIYAVAYIGMTHLDLEKYVSKISWMHIGEINKLIKFFKKEGVENITMVGKVHKKAIYSDIRPDLKALKLLAGLKDRSDTTILKALTKEFEKNDFKVKAPSEYVQSLLIGPGILTTRKPSKTELKDIEFGRKIAKELADADIGHTVIVKDRAVLALEAIEGTDEAIKRGGKLGGEGAVVLKSSRPNQDLRLDMPVIGPNTIEAMAEVKSSCLAFDANMTLILEKDKVISIANANNIAIVSML